MNNRHRNVYRRRYYRRRYNNEARGACLALFFGVPLALIVLLIIAQAPIVLLLILGIGGAIWIGIAIDKKANQEYYRKLKEYQAKQKQASVSTSSQYASHPQATVQGKYSQMTPASAQAHPTASTSAQATDKQLADDEQEIDEIIEGVILEAYRDRETRLYRESLSIEIENDLEPLVEYPTANVHRYLDVIMATAVMTKAYNGLTPTSKPYSLQATEQRQRLPFEEARDKKWYGTPVAAQRIKARKPS